MPLKLLKDGEKCRMAGCIFWLEDLKRVGLSYGQLCAFLEESVQMESVCSPVHDRDRYTEEDVRGWLGRHEEYMDKYTADVKPEFADIVPKVGDPKKAHIHVYFKAKGPKYGKDWAKAVEDFYPIPENRWVVVPDWDKIVRYCAHMDAPNKAQYDPLTVRGFCNADVSALMETNRSNKYETIEKVNQYITSNRIRWFNRLNAWAIGTHDVEIMACVTGRHSYWETILRSKREEAAERKKAKEKAQEKVENTLKR